MPLPKRAIEPVHVSRVNVPKNCNELEFVSNASLANIIRQLASLSHQAADLFSELTQEVSQVINRVTKLQTRTENLTQQVTEMEHAVTLNEPTDGRGTTVHYDAKNVYCSTQLTESQVVSQRNLPTSVLHLYNQCAPPPPLYHLDPLRDDGKKSLKFYTDPSFFFELWSKEMLQSTQKVPKSKKHHYRKRPPKKKKLKETQAADYSAMKDGKELMGAGLGSDHHSATTPASPGSIDATSNASTAPSSAAGAGLAYNSHQHFAPPMAYADKGPEGEAAANASGLPAPPVSSDGYLVSKQYLINQAAATGITDDHGAMLPPQPMMGGGQAGPDGSVGMPAHGNSGGTGRDYNFDESSQYAPLPNNFGLPAPPSPAMLSAQVAHESGMAHNTMANAGGLGPHDGTMPPLPPPPLPPPPPPPPPPSTDATENARRQADAMSHPMEQQSELLAAIRRGITLGRVGERQRTGRQVGPGGAGGPGGGDMASLFVSAQNSEQQSVQAIFDEVRRRRKHIEYSDSESDNEDWCSDEN